MEYLKVTAAPDLALAPPVFRAIAASPHATESRLLDWNHATEGRVVALFRVEGEREPMAEALVDAPAVRGVECTPVGDGRFHALVRLDAASAPMLLRVFEAIVRRGILVEKPVVYRDGQVHATFVGESDALQATIDALPSAVDVTVREVGGYRGELGAGEGLSSRQREALHAALALGYYEVPRRATHQDVAERLGCAPSTATEHLQKAEAALVRSALRGPGDGGERDRVD